MTKVVAEVILRGPEGLSINDAATPPLSAAELRRYQPTPDTVDRARAALAARGFGLLETGASGFGIVADHTLFEEVFTTRLEQRGEGDAASWQPETPIVVPDDLSEWIAAVAFPSPPEFFP